MIRIDVAAGLQVFEARDHVAGEILIRRGMPVASRFANTPFVVAKHGDALTY